MERVADTVGVNLRARVGVTEERVVARGAAVRVESKYLAAQGRQILCVGTYSVVTDAPVELAVRSEAEGPAVMDESCRLGFQQYRLRAGCVARYGYARQPIPVGRRSV